MKKNIVFRLSKKIAVFGLAAAVAVTPLASVSSYAYSGQSGQYTRSERLEQISVSHEFAANELGVVNFEATVGDKGKNIASMEQYIAEADEKGVKILVFPEMCVTGYVASSDPNSEEYKWAVDSAEPLDGPTAQKFAEIADEDDMWIIYGATQTIENDNEHAYNSAFVCSPEGDVTAYQKITPVEGSWCVPGETPVIIDAGEYGKLGISICFDTYSTPELERYYSAMGCNILVNPTATGGGWSVNNMENWEEYYKLRLESIASRDGFTILSSDLVGKDGDFPGGSVILNGEFSGVHYYAGEETSDGSKTNNAKIITGEAGVLTNTVALTATTGTTCSNIDFNPEMYAQLYKELADKVKSGESLSYKAVSDGPKVATVNMTGYWGNKSKTLAKMIDYIEEAGEQGVNILVFPETVLSGYGYLEPDQDPFYHKYGVSMQVYTAETIPGPSTETLSEYAKKYNMYIIFGMTEKDESGSIYDDKNNNTLDNAEKVYNSAAILYPDGTIDSYQKIHRAGNMEWQWSVSGTTPKIIDTPWGKAGIDICMDGHFFPELGRYYAAMGCTMFIHPTATGGNAWYRSTRIASYTDRDGMAAITCNLLGGDGIYTAPGDTKYDSTDDAANFDAEGNFIGGSVIPETIYNKNEIADDPYWNSANWTYGTFASISFVSTKGATNKENPKVRINYNNTGMESEGFEERGGTSPLGLEVVDMDLSGCGFSASSSTFNPDLYSKLYDKLATLYRGGYTSIYGEDAVAEPVTINLTKKDEVTSSTPQVSTTPSITPEASITPEVTKTPEVTETATPTPKPVKKNDVVVVKGASYKVLSTTKNNASVAYQAPENKNSKIITIPTTIKYNNKTYKVTTVSDKACINMSKLTKVTIGSNVKVIGKNAFKNCKKLKSVTVGKDVSTIKTSAFYGCKNLKTLTIKSTKLKSVGKNAIKGINKKAVIKCPSKKVSTYKKLFKTSTGYVKTIKIKR